MVPFGHLKELYSSRVSSRLQCYTGRFYYFGLLSHLSLLFLSYFFALHFLHFWHFQSYASCVRFIFLRLFIFLLLNECVPSRAVGSWPVLRACRLLQVRPSWFADEWLLVLHSWCLYFFVYFIFVVLPFGTFISQMESSFGCFSLSRAHEMYARRALVGWYAYTRIILAPEKIGRKGTKKKWHPQGKCRKI